MTKSSTDPQEQFNRHAANYAVSVPHSSGRSLNILTEWASLGRYDLGIDLATGPGFTAFAIAEFCETVVASDIADGMLNQARNIAEQRGIDNVRFEVVDAQKIPYTESSFDIVTCRTAPHHFPDIGKFLSEVHRVLKPEGVFLLCDTTTSEASDLAEWHQRAEALRDPSHVLAPSPSQWRSLVGKAGFEITHEKATQVNMTFRDWVKRSGTPDEVVRELHRDFASASNSVKDEYGIVQLDGNDFAFYWPVFTCRAVKS